MHWSSEEGDTRDMSMGGGKQATWQGGARGSDSGREAQAMHWGWRNIKDALERLEGPR